MGQKKTWGFHHTPFTVFWKVLSVDYTHQWQPILENHFMERYFSTAPDRTATSNFFFWFQKQNYSAQNAQPKLKNRQAAVTKQKPGFRFLWIKNANRGTNETTASNVRYIKLNQNLVLIHTFFRKFLKIKRDKYQLYRSNQKPLQTQQWLRKWVFDEVSKKNPFIRKYRYKKRPYLTTEKTTAVYKPLHRSLSAVRVLKNIGIFFKKYFGDKKLKIRYTRQNLKKRKNRFKIYRFL